MSVYGIPAGIALVADGIEMVTRGNIYKKNKKNIDEFREELNNLNPKKQSYGVVIPMYKNPEGVNKTLYNLIENVGIKNSEIITVDDYSNDGGEVKRVSKKYNVESLCLTKEEKDVRKVRSQRKGVQKWLQRGKEYVVFLDSDCTFNSEKKDLELSMAEMNLLGLNAMSGQVLPEINKNSNLLERIQYLEYKQAMRAGRGSMYSLKKHHDKKAQHLEELKNKYSVSQSSQICISGALGIFKSQEVKDVLDKMKSYGGGEDVEITQRFLANGNKIGYNNNLLVKTDAPKDIFSWAKQRDYWAQFLSSSHFFDADYKKNIVWKNKKPNLDAGGTALIVQAVKDVYTHPIKIASFPFLAMNPLLFTGFLGMYYGLDIYSREKIHEKGEERDLLAGLLLPIYKIGQLLGPTTTGYGKQFTRIFNRKRKRNKKAKNGK